MDLTEPETLARQIAGVLTARRETVAVAESSAGGLISAALLAVPGASRFYLGGQVVYTARALNVLRPGGLGEVKDQGMRSSSEPYAAWLAGLAQSSYRADWGLSETGAAGPDGNPYGDPPGHSCVGLAGPMVGTRTIRTGSGDRAANMVAFAVAGLTLLRDALENA
ncbi:MAG: CinA family protein [Alphaproteobacteria bacterium]